MVSRQTLGVRSDVGSSTSEDRITRQRWYAQIAGALDSFPSDWPVGIITHKGIREEARLAIKAMGFDDTRVLHYGDERGSNIMECARVLVLLGLPIPNLDEFKEEAQAFFSGAEPLDFTWEKQQHLLDMRDGSKVPVMVGGYWNEPVASYYRQKCQWGLYQALHRIRPYNPRNYERHIFIFTNMPIPDVPVDHLLGPWGQRFDLSLDTLRQTLDKAGECTTTELADILTANGQEGATRWVQRNVEALYAAADCEFVPGSGRNPGRFVRHGQ